MVKATGENFIASDPLALISETQEFIYLEDNDLAEITEDTIHIYNGDQKVSSVNQACLVLNQEATERGHIDIS